MLTTKDIAERLKIMDEITVMELLEISAEDLVERFWDIIEEKADQLELFLTGFEEEDEGERNEQYEDEDDYQDFL